MTCPQCGATCADDAARCPECNHVFAAAVEAEDAPEWNEGVIVLETSDEGQLMVARSLLDAEGIRSFADGEEGQQLIAAGPIRLRVPAEDQQAARALLSHLDSADEE